MGITFNCDICGTEKTVKPYLYNKSNHHFCSTRCFQTWWKENKLGGEKSINWQGGKILLTCDMCSSTYYNWKSQVKNNKHNFCSDNCKFKYISSVKQIGGVTSDGKQFRKCIICKRVIECHVGIYTNRYGSCCSKECALKYNKIRKTLYGDDIYCILFSAEFKNRVIQFFGGKCVLCGSTRGDKRGNNLSVHHVFYDKDAGCESDNSMYVPLCASCHTKSHRTTPTFYQQLFKDLIITQYDGKCYYTREEFYE